MLVVPLIERKRDGGTLTPEEWSALVAAYTADRIPDYQMSALLMAVLLRGLERQELAALTDAMLASGLRLAFDSWGTPRVDKHSTGGVGDKVSLVLAPLVAACGVAVPMMSGRGLGHTGGTLDKLEAIPGFRTGLSLTEAKAQVMKLGCAMIGQTPEIAPADRRLYALRDVTGTVAAIPLIAASIMSKKLAEGLNALVLDVKRGTGAFLPKVEQSLELAQTMIALGEDRGCPTVALLTAMDRPLGRACGNALEPEDHRPGGRRHGRGASRGGRCGGSHGRVRHHGEAWRQDPGGRADRLGVREGSGGDQARLRGAAAGDRGRRQAHRKALAVDLTSGDEGRRRAAEALDPRCRGSARTSRFPR